METEIEILQKLLKEDPSNFQARRELSIMLAKNGFNEEALSNLQYLSKYFPEDAEIHYNLGILYEKTKDFEKAKASYKKAIEISPQEDFIYNLGEVLVELKEWDAAIEVFNDVLKADPNDGNCYFNIGICYLNKDETNLATDFFQKAVQLNPKDIFAHFHLGNIYQNNGLTNFAIESYNKVLNISPDYSWAYYNLAAIAYKNEDLDSAREYLTKTIEYNSQDIEAYKLLTKIMLKQNDTEEIITILRTRLEKEENGDLYYILSQVYKKIGENDEYQEHLEKALKCSLTLTYPKNILKKELEYQVSINPKNIPQEMEEYSSEDEYFEDEEDEEDVENDVSSYDNDDNEDDDEIYIDEDDQ